jgi:DNA polymerase-3 subunit epsilon
MRLLGLDFETTGLDPEVDVVTEVGVVLWDTERHCPLALDSYFVSHPGIDITEEITQITGILPEDLKEFGIESQDALYRLSEHIHIADAVVAHNGTLFDKLFYTSWCKKIAQQEPSEKTWIDTQTDIDYPDEITTRKLTYLAAEHGFLNPFAHRAVFDVLTMMRILDKYSIDKIFYSAQQPTLMVRAKVSYDDRQLAKDHSFRWDGQNKIWVKAIKAHKYNPEDYKFETKVIG